MSMSSAVVTSARSGRGPAGGDDRADGQAGSAPGRHRGSRRRPGRPGHGAWAVVMGIVGAVFLGDLAS